MSLITTVFARLIPARLFEILIASLPRQGRLLDLGCGPGQIARHLSAFCEHVVAVDPSRAMLALAGSLENGGASNIRWMHKRAEDADLGSERFTTIVAANSIHWMDADRLFTKLKYHVAEDHTFAVIAGDEAHDPPWRADWVQFLIKWIPIATGESFDLPRKTAEWSAYKSHVDMEVAETLISPPLTQSISDFISCQHSRDAFAPSRLQGRMTEFDGELRELLIPHAANGLLSFSTKTELTLGKIRGV